MSSSRRSSRPRKSPRPGACPTCGGRRVIPVTDDVVLRVRGRRYRIEGVAHEQCQACGERIFGLEASRQFDGVVLRGKRGRVA